MRFPRIRRCLSTLAVLAAFGIGATGSAQSAGGRLEARFLPGDRFTSVEESPLLVLVRSTDGAAPAPEQLQALAERLEVVTWPEGGRVVGEVRVQAGEERGEPARVVFAPAQRLADRWYALRLSRLPAGVTVAGDARTLPGGAVGIRFRTGSQIVVRKIQARRDATGLLVRATLSERFRPSAAAAVRVLQEGKALTCALPRKGESAALESAAPSAGAPKDGVEIGASEVEVRCTGAASELPLEIALAPEVRTLAGRPAGGSDGAPALRLRAPQTWRSGDCAEGCEEDR